MNMINNGKGMLFFSPRQLSVKPLCLCVSVVNMEV